MLIRAIRQRHKYLDSFGDNNSSDNPADGSNLSTSSKCKI